MTVLYHRFIFVRPFLKNNFKFSIKVCTQKYIFELLFNFKSQIIQNRCFDYGYVIYFVKYFAIYVQVYEHVQYE